MPLSTSESQEIRNVLSDVIGQCGVEIHNLKGLEEHLQGVRDRLDGGTLPTGRELALIFKMHELAMHSESLLAALKMKA